MKHLFIINPAAGRYNHAGELRPEIEKVMENRGEQYEIVLTDYPMHAADIVRQNALKGAPLRVYICGGDGTLNEAVNGAAGFSNVALTNFPCGSGNDFIRIFGKDAPRFSNFAELVDGDVRQVDLLESDGRYCVNICSVGFDARVCSGVPKLKRLPLISGKGAYNLSVFINLFLGMHHKYKLSIDGKRYDGRFTMIVACNGRFYGGGFNPVPEALPDDGLIDFLLVGPVNLLTVARVVKKFREGRHTLLPEYTSWVRGKRAEIKCDRESAVNLDGEIVLKERLSFSVSKHKLNFIVPKGALWTAPDISCMVQA
ncbi:MAG: YegS/Rv2252/BmrU family lipid kinase [Bacillota bacterium]|nr:YegS/Rv2252/BmrU family lipid kinase [Bacillota bacterium]